MAKKKPKKPVRGSGISITLPTEPMAGAAKDKPVFEVMVQDEGTPILEYKIKEGNSIQFPRRRDGRGIHAASREY